MTPITLSPESVDAIARQIVAALNAQDSKARTSEVLIRNEARAYVKKNSLSAFHAWCREWNIRPYKHGRYSRTQLDLALSREARRRAP